MFVVDLAHFMHLSEDVPEPTRLMAERLFRIVRSATVGPTGIVWPSALACTRRPGRQACPGFLELVRTDIPPRIHWRCPVCGDDGIISGWQRTFVDLRSGAALDDLGGDVIEVIVPPSISAALFELVFLDPGLERMIHRGRSTPEGILLVGPPDDFELLVDAIAAEANHEHNRRRKQRLDAAFDHLNELLAPA